MPPEVVQRSWDDVVPAPEDESGGGEAYVLLPQGIYQFTVVNTKALAPTEEATEKTPAGTHRMEVTLRVQHEGNKVHLRKVFYALSSFDKITAAFFLTVGLRKHKEPIRFAWREARGRDGWCKVDNRHGTGKYAGKLYNEVAFFVDPAKIESQESPATAEQTEPAEQEVIPF